MRARLMAWSVCLGVPNPLAVTNSVLNPVLVGAAGFEPATPCSQSRCATRLRHAPYRTPRRPAFRYTLRRAAARRAEMSLSGGRAVAAGAAKKALTAVEDRIGDLVAGRDCVFAGRPGHHL